MNKFFFPAVAIITFPMILAAAACSDDPSAPAVGAPSLAPDASSSSDSSSPPSSSDSGVDTGAVAAKSGLIAISGDVVQAAFWEGTLSLVEAQGYTCTKSKEGPCEIADCSVSAEAAAGKIPKFPTAGAITVRITDQKITLGADANGNYSEKSREDMPHTPTFEVTAAGAEVPPFSKSLTPTQSNLELTAPLADGDGKLVIDRAADLEVTWTVEASNAKVLASISALPSVTRAVEVSCTFDGTAGKGTIPAAALGKLPVAPAGLSVLPVQRLDFDQGPWKIQTLIYGRGGQSQPTLE